MPNFDLNSLLPPSTGTVLLGAFAETTDRMGLPFPPVPPALIAAMREHGTLVVGSRDIDFPLAELPLWQDEWLSRPVADYLVYGVDGWGVTSQVLHYYLVSGGLAVFLQHRIPGPLAEVQASAMSDLLDELPNLLGLVEAAQKSGLLGPDEGILWVDSDLYDSGWARVRHGEPLRWRSSPAVEGIKALLRQPEAA